MSVITFFSFFSSSGNIALVEKNKCVQNVQILSDVKHISCTTAQAHRLWCMLNICSVSPGWKYGPLSLLLYLGWDHRSPLQSSRLIGVHSLDVHGMVTCESIWLIALQFRLMKSFLLLERSWTHCFQSSLSETSKFSPSASSPEEELYWVDGRGRERNLMLQVYGLQVLYLEELQQQHQRRNTLLLHMCFKTIYSLRSLYRLRVNH